MMYGVGTGFPSHFYITTKNREHITVFPVIVLRIFWCAEFAGTAWFLLAFTACVEAGFSVLTEGTVAFKGFVCRFLFGALFSQFCFGSFAAADWFI